MTKPATIEDIARKALNGDREALDALVRSLQGDIYGLALRMLWNHEDAEDATQEILIRIVTHLSQFGFRSRLKTWAYRVAVNYVLDVKESAAERLQRSVESLLDFSRMEGGAKTYRREEQDAGALAREVVDAFAAESAAAGFRIHCKAPAEPLRIVGDREALFHVFWNLLDNAVKYSGESRDIEVAVSPSGGRVDLSVRDHGIGIPAAERVRIFARFTRGEEAVRQGIRGTGIGLAMARHIVDAHGGNIELESEPGRGSRFTVRLPKAG